MNVILKTLLRSFLVVFLASKLLAEKSDCYVFELPAGISDGSINFVKKGPSGYILFSAPTGSGTWIFDFEQYPVENFDNLLCMPDTLAFSLSGDAWFSVSALNPREIVGRARCSRAVVFGQDTSGGLVQFILVKESVVFDAFRRAQKSYPVLIGAKKFLVRCNFKVCFVDGPDWYLKPSILTTDVFRVRTEGAE